MTQRTDYQKQYRQSYKDQAKRVNLTLSLSEHRSLQRAAKASGEPLSAYVKRRALEAHEVQEQAVIPEELLEQLADLDRVIRTIANNVNQMARHSNRVRQVLDDTQPFLYIQSLESELKRVIAAASAPHNDETGGA